MEIRKLNSLRGIAALIVMMAHYGDAYYGDTREFAHGIVGRGVSQIGVMLFFMLSGFLMSYLYLNKDFNRIEVKKFVVARIARVVPLYLLIVLFSFYFEQLGIETTYGISSFSVLVSHLTLLKCDRIFWTIPIEIHFYILFILLWWVFSKKPLYAFFLMTLIYCAISVFDFPLFMGSVMQVRYLIVIFICIHFFFIGVVFGRVYDRWKPPKRLMSGAYLLFLPLFPVIYCHIFSASFDNANNMWMDFGIFFCMGLIFFLILFFVPDNNVLLSNKIGDFLGKISYSLYLLHIPTIRAVYTFLPARKSPVYFLVCLALAILISTASYLMVEKLTRDAIRAYFDVGRSSPKEAKGRKRSSARSMPALNEQKH